MPQTRKSTRAEAKQQRHAEILQAGRRQLATRGAAGLSLREVARELGMVSSAVYRYVASRDELLTLLLVDAYTSLADNVDAALDSTRDGHGPARLLVLARTMRTWALGHPEQWGLIYGAPVPGYQAPAEQTTHPGTRVMRRLILEVQGAHPATTDIPPAVTAFVKQGIRDLDGDASVHDGLLAVRYWCAIVGCISMELFGQLGPELHGSDAGEQLLDLTVEGLTRVP